MADALKKTVCIVGAGPSGLVAAKTLLWDRRAQGRFHVTVFESQPRVGGLWPSNPDDRDGLVHPQMLVNQSRHTVQFSDMPWDATEDNKEAAKGPGPGSGRNSAEAPEFPRAWQVGQYLERYWQRYGLGRDNLDLRLCCRVVKVEPVDGGRSGWHVWTQATASTTSAPEGTVPVVDAGVFDYLLVASGYFGSPATPDGLHPSTGPVIHSSAYRDLPTLFTDKPRSGKILVVGGQFSGVEIAATIANHVSSARHSPKESLVASSANASVLDPEALSLHHLIQKPYWVLPLHTSPSPAVGAPPFLPLDLTSYNLQKRPRPLTDTQGYISVEAARRSHSFLRSLLGTDQAEFHPELALNNDAVLDAPPYVAVSDTYLEHVRSGMISVSKGRLKNVSGTTAVTDVFEAIDDVAAIVLATGFSAATSIAFFPESVKKALHFDRNDTHQVFALAFHGTHHPAVPHLAFVGFYRSPFWGVMEMQARLATALFVSDTTRTTPELPPPGSIPWYPSAMPQWPRLAQALTEDRSIERALSLRANLQRSSQSPMGDYVFLMNIFAEVLGIPRRSTADKDPALSTPEVTLDVVTPAHYVDEEVSASAAKMALATLTAHTDAIVSAGLHHGRFVAHAVFRSLQGTWHLDRQLTSRLPSHPSGRFLGTADFRVRAATKDGLKERGVVDPEELEYLYVEDGTFTAAKGGPSFRATRRYIWRYNTVMDQLSVWFARTDDASRADYLFHALQFAVAPFPDTQPATPRVPTSGPLHPGRWVATACHLCINDFYDVQYQFAFSGVNLKDWNLRYDVRGPKKDYTIAGTYRRQ